MTPRVLIVDDDAQLLELLCLGLKQTCDTMVASNGRDALDLINSDAVFDFILCDVNLPDVTGQLIYETVRGTKPGLEKKFIFMTGGAYTREAANFLGSNPNLQIEKPFDLKTLRKLIGISCP